MYSFFGVGASAWIIIRVKSICQDQSGSNSDLPSRKGALREAKRDADIPYNQEPLDIQYEPMRDRESAGGHVQKDGNGRVIQTRE